MGTKGHPESNCGGVGGGGGGGWMMKKKKMAMLAVVILVAVMGVMMVQKKERQYAKESKRKNQDLNAKLYSLRTQKNELNNKIMEMQSTIGSIKDEQRALEIAIEEKQNEIKVKESQIKDLKSIHTPPKIWSVSSDDPSNREVNLIDNITSTKRSSWFDHSVNEEKLKFQASNVAGKVQKPSDEDTRKLATLKEGDLSLNHKVDTKTEIRNTTEVRLIAEEKGNGLSIKGRRSFIEGNGSQTDGPADKNRLEANREEGVTEVTRLKSKNYSTEAVHRAANRRDEDEPEIETDTNSSTESRNGSEVDHDYKED